MLCYRDRTFCTYYVGCVYKDTCGRALTDKIKEEAKVWWDSFGSIKNSPEPPIAIYSDKPDCFKRSK